jgi:hypothetical protein
MGETLLDQLDTIERKLAELIHAVRQIRLDQVNQGQDAPTPPRVQDAPTTNAPAHETLPQITQPRSIHGSLEDVLGFPKDGR